MAFITNVPDPMFEGRVSDGMMSIVIGSLVVLLVIIVIVAIAVHVHKKRKQASVRYGESSPFGFICLHLILSDVFLVSIVLQ